MGDVNVAQVIVSVLLSGGLLSGIMAILTKSIWSPESKNDLARLGNEFAHQLLEDAKSERQELRLTISELENLVTSKKQTIERLHELARQKDIRILELQERQVKLARKVESGDIITLRDIFGEMAPPGFKITPDEVV